MPATPSQERSPRVLLVSFDGLRPDLVSRELTPNIQRVMDRGVTLSHHRTVYPSETRVAFPSLVTGATPGRHGMVGNQYVDRAATPQRYIDTADARLLDRLNKESGGNLFSAPTLGEILARNSKTLAVLSTNTPGTTRLFHHKAEDFGHVRLSGHFAEACTPEKLLNEVEARFGALPPITPRGTPDFEGQELIVSIFLDIIWPSLRPDVTVISFGEPDLTSHFNGTGAEETQRVIRCCDEQLGRLLDWWEAEGMMHNVQIALLSDHGHVTGHTRISVFDSLKRAGFCPAKAPSPDADVVVVPGHVGALYLPSHSEATLDKLVNAITSEEWCGCVFTAPRNHVEGIIKGTFSRSLIGVNHDRSPDIYFAFRTDDSTDPFGLIGGTYYDNDRRAGLGLHGGLHPSELGSLGVLAGAAFQQGHISSTPSGICDFAPTVLHLLGIDQPKSMTGRVLRETFADAEDFSDQQEQEDLIFETGRGSYSQALRLSRIRNSIYIDGGWAGPTANADVRRNESGE